MIFLILKASFFSSVFLSKKLISRSFGFLFLMAKAKKKGRCVSNSISYMRPLAPSQGSISSTCLLAAFTWANPNSKKRQSSHSVEKKLTNSLCCCTSAELHFMLCSQVWWNWHHQHHCTAQQEMYNKCYSKKNTGRRLKNSWDFEDKSENDTDIKIS